MTDQRRWFLAAAVAALVITVAIIFRGRISPDFWPLDKSRIGPNLLSSLIQWAIVLVVATLLYPPWRRAVHRFLDTKLNAVHGKLDGLLAHHVKHERQLKALHETVNILAANHAELHDSVRGLHEKIDAQGKGDRSAS